MVEMGPRLVVRRRGLEENLKTKQKRDCRNGARE